MFYDMVVLYSDISVLYVTVNNPDPARALHEQLCLPSLKLDLSSLFARAVFPHLRRVNTLLFQVAYHQSKST